MTRAGRRFGAARVLDALLALAGAAALALVGAGALAPTLSSAVDPAAVQSDGGHAYTFSPGFSPPWPYAVPSHPAFALAPGDVRVLEDGEPIGALEPAHALIRERGGGLYNLWESTLWFSPGDGADPRDGAHTYALEVRTRLGPPAAAARAWALAALLALALARLGLAAVPPLRRAAGRVFRPAARAYRAGASRLPLTFGRTYALVSAVLLGAFVAGTLARPAVLFTQSDSVEYIRPGLVWASGGDMAGQSLRDLGYPLLCFIAVKLGTLALLPRVQLVLIAAGIACLLAALYVPLSAMASRLRRAASVPSEAVAAGAACAAAALVLLLASHDLFVIDVEAAMAEGPHLLPTALALALFLAGWTARSGRNRIVLLALASLSAYLSTEFKPHTLLVSALCLASTAVVAARHRRALRSPAVLAVCAAAAGIAFGVHRLDAWVTPRGFDFGPKILFCNHLDVVEPVFDASTPERARVAALARGVLSRVDGWPLMGYAGDNCIYDDAFSAAIDAAAAADGLGTPRWEMREFVGGVLRNPLRYARDIARQTAHFLRHPIADVDVEAHTDLTDADLRVFAPYAAAVNMPRSAWSVDAANWVARDHRRIAGAGKAGLGVVSDTFAPVTLLGTSSALVALLVRRRRRADQRAEICVVATGAFVMCFAATVILTHTFDTARYVTDILPLSLSWWLLSASYGAYLLAALADRAVRRWRSGAVPAYRPAPGLSL